MNICFNFVNLFFFIIVKKMKFLLFDLITKNNIRLIYNHEFEANIYKFKA